MTTVDPSQPCMQFGWEGDGGVGERLIAQILDGTKTATCGFVAAYTDAELAEVRGNVGHVVPVVDRHGAIHAHVRVLEVFETPFGDPDPRLVAGEGDGDDVERFQADHRVVWELDFGDRALADDEPLLVELFERVDPA